jgi:two-component system, OmpR family, manganese sensing sensor histidine kinase
MPLQYSAFQKIRYQLLFANLTVLALILAVFTIAVRVFVIRNLSAQLSEKLVTLAQGAAASADFQNGRLSVGQDFSPRSLNERHQALQWYDLQGKLLSQQGDTVISLPLSTDLSVQYQAGKNSIQAVTLPIIDNDDKQLHGYVRASQSLHELHETIERLDWGLGGGILVALVFSSIGGVWLTRKSLQPIEESFARLKQFTADASHELRSPLMAIKSNLQVSLKHPEGMRTEDSESFMAIASATEQMTRLTEDLLFLARTDKILNREWQPIDLGAILHELVQLYQPQAIARKINLKVKLSTHLYLAGDSVQLKRLFTNLIANALNHTSDGGTVEVQATKTLEILPTKTGLHLEVQVRDTGIGIAPEHIGSVFERFWQADRARSQKTEGTGLGLAIAQAIARAHGGKITVASQVGIGSCFTVQIPSSLTQK